MYGTVQYELAKEMKIKVLEFLYLNAVKNMQRNRSGGWCDASNRTFANMMQVSTRTIQNWNDKLKDLDYLITDDSKEDSCKRKVTDLFMDLYTNYMEQKTEGTKKFHGGVKNVHGGYEKISPNNNKDNNSYNNTNKEKNTKKEIDLSNSIKAFGIEPFTDKDKMIDKMMILNGAESEAYRKAATAYNLALAKAEDTTELKPKPLNEKEKALTKKEKKPAQKKKKIIVYPFNTESFMNAWKEWKLYRATATGKKKLLYNATTEQAALTILMKVANEMQGTEQNAIELITLAIAHNWRSFYAPKPVDKQQQKQTYDGSGITAYLKNKAAKLKAS